MFACFYVFVYVSKILQVKFIHIFVFTLINFKKITRFKCTYEHAICVYLDSIVGTLKFRQCMNGILYFFLRSLSHFGPYFFWFFRPHQRLLFGSFHLPYNNRRLKTGKLWLETIAKKKYDKHTFRKWKWKQWYFLTEMIPNIIFTSTQMSSNVHK